MTAYALHGLCSAAEKHVNKTGELGFHRRSIAKRRSPLVDVVCGRLVELGCRVRPCPGAPQAPPPLALSTSARMMLAGA